MLIESFSQTILKWLRIPPGSSVRKANVSTSSNVDITNNDYVQTILEITVDDICIGDCPLSIDFDQEAGKDIDVKLHRICDEFNSVVKDIARDLCQDGYSIWDISVDKDDNSLLVIPFLEDVEFYLTNKKKVVCYTPDKKQLKKKLVFINYTKRSLELLEDKDRSGLLFKINPSPMQLKNVEKTIEGIINAETAIAKYRSLLRPVRIANVDIGTAQGDVQKAAVDSIASSINCNSESLGNGTVYTDFDDNIPVLPNRKGLGKVDLTSDIPSANLKDLADLDYWLNKLNLIMRFPGTYMDFSKALSESAVSMIRGDLRYVKLTKAVQTKIVTTLNKFISESKFAKFHPSFSLTTFPSSEDDDVMEALSNYCEITSSVEEFIIGSEEDNKLVRLHRLTLLKDLFSTSMSSPMLQKWFDDFETFIEEIESKGISSDSDESEEFGSDDSDDLFGGSDDSDDLFGGSEGSDESEDMGSEPEGEEPTESEDVELLDEQS